jgi:hypothetical protein
MAQKKGQSIFHETSSSGLLAIGIAKNWGKIEVARLLYDFALSASGE